MTRQEKSDNYTAAADMDIVKQVLDGDLNALELIMRRYNQRLYRIARGVVQNDMDAEDVVQDAYIHAYENLGQFQAKGPLFVWLAKITLNEALKHLRSAKGTKNSISFDDPLHTEEANHMADLITGLPTPEQDVARKELHRLLETAIGSLPDAYRMVFIFRGVEEMSVEHTAECLDIEPATVKTRYHRARKLLQQQLADLVDSHAGGVYSFDGIRCDRIVSGVFLRLANRNRS
ncbi:RNA polymerase sigma factor [Geomonas agri]|uniref:RNA polymerase sigma factor n=1 Tax=Geomonas agri TaxID=2873702 RepID=UPI001CD51DF6|nr:RNA polymerase sigma factor [Geomonas agri]